MCAPNPTEAMVYSLVFNTQDSVKYCKSSQYDPAKLSSAYAAMSNPRSRFEFWLVVVVKFNPPMSHHSTPFVLMGYKLVSRWFGIWFWNRQELTKHVKCLHQEQVLRHS